MKVGLLCFTLLISGIASSIAAGVRVTYLGTNGYVLQSDEATILIDPYFTRIGLLTAGLNLRAVSSPERVSFGLAHVPRRVDAVLVTHGHFDHLLDVPEVTRRTGAHLYASPTSVCLAQAAGMKPTNCSAVRVGNRIKGSGFRIRVLAASHDHVLGRIPFEGTLESVPRSPRRAGDWLCGEPLAFLIEIGGSRIYVDSGGTPSVIPPSNSGPVDLAILGVALPDSRVRFADTVRNLRPRVVIPSHQDNFFRPLERGFAFNFMTDFPRVKRDAAALDTRLVVLDYFHSWTLR